jgi:hypothetical protein
MNYTAAGILLSREFYSGSRGGQIIFGQMTDEALRSWMTVFYGKLQVSPVIILALFFLSLVKARQSMARDEVNP